MRVFSGALRTPREADRWRAGDQPTGIKQDAAPDTPSKVPPAPPVPPLPTPLPLSASSLTPYSAFLLLLLLSVPPFLFPSTSSLDYFGVHILLVGAIPHTFLLLSCLSFLMSYLYLYTPVTHSFFLAFILVFKSTFLIFVTQQCLPSTYSPPSSRPSVLCVSLPLYRCLFLLAPASPMLPSAFLLPAASNSLQPLLVSIPFLPRIPPATQTSHFSLKYLHGPLPPLPFHPASPLPQHDPRQAVQYIRGGHSTRPASRTIGELREAL